MLKTTIKISDEIKKSLDKFKVHPRQSYNEVLDLLIKNYINSLKGGNN